MPHSFVMPMFQLPNARNTAGPLVGRATTLRPCDGAGPNEHDAMVSRKLSDTMRGEQEAQQKTELEPTTRKVVIIFCSYDLNPFVYDLHYKESLHFFMTYDLAMADYPLST